MNQYVSSKDDLLSQQKPPHGEIDFWAVLLDAVFVVLQRWKLLVAGTLIAGVATAAVAFMLPRSYQSYAYLGPLDEPVARRTSTLLFSPLVLDATLLQLARQPFSSMTADEARLDLSKRVHFAPVQSVDSKYASTYMLDVVDTDPARAHDILTALIDVWLVTMKPPPDRRASLERLLGAMDLQAADLSTAITQLMKRPELLSGDVKTGYAPVNVAEMIKLRTDGLVKSEELKSAIAGPGRDAIVLPPTKAERPVGPSKRLIVLVTMAATLVILIGFVLFRDLFLPAFANSGYEPKLQRLYGALRMQKPGS